MRESLKEFIKKKAGTGNLKAVELGVMAGRNSQDIFNVLNGDISRLYLIDSWKLSYRPEMHDRLVDTAKRFENNPYVTIIKQDSTNCLELFNDNSLDYVYIDDAHNYAHVLSEIKSWYLKVKKGGMLSGHDINHNAPERVLKAVQDFCVDNKITFECQTNENEKVGDWWIWK
jgi:predicted O-methyltransferase YrrM